MEAKKIQLGDVVRTRFWGYEVIVLILTRHSSGWSGVPFGHADRSAFEHDADVSIWDPGTHPVRPDLEEPYEIIGHVDLAAALALLPPPQ